MKLRRALPNEVETVKRAALGDADAFEEIVAAHRAALMSLACRLLRNPDDAHDVVQETLIKALRALPEFDAERPIRPWLCRICSNCCVDAVRNRRRDPASLDPQEASLSDGGHTVEDSVGRSVLRTEVLEAIERLPDRYRRIILMRHFQHKDVNQIAVELDKPEGTIKSWLFRARALLKKDLSVGLS